jgi:hypothetical protein
MQGSPNNSVSKETRSLFILMTNLQIRIQGFENSGRGSSLCRVPHKNHPQRGCTDLRNTLRYMHAPPWLIHPHEAALTSRSLPARPSLARLQDSCHACVLQHIHFVSRGQRRHTSGPFPNPHLSSCQAHTRLANTAPRSNIRRASTRTFTRACTAGACALDAGPPGGVCPTGP